MNPTQGVISEAIDLYKKHFGHLFLTALVVYLVIAILTALLSSVAGIIGVLISLALSIIGLFIVQAALVEAVADIRDGRADLSVADTLKQGASRIGSVAGASIVAGIGIGLGFILLIIPGLVLLTWWAVIVPVIVLEGAAAFGSFSRSRDLVRGHDFQVFGVIVLQFLILMVVGFVLGIVLSALPDSIEAFFSSIVSGALTGPFTALVVTLLYFRLKAAKEGAGPGAALPPSPAPPPVTP